MVSGFVLVLLQSLQENIRLILELYLLPCHMLKLKYSFTHKNSGTKIVTFNNSLLYKDSKLSFCNITDTEMIV